MDTEITTQLVLRISVIKQLTNIEKIQFYPYFTLYTKIKSRYIIDINVRSKVVKLLKDKIVHSLAKWDPQTRRICIIWKS